MVTAAAEETTGMKFYGVDPAGTPKGAVIVIQEAFGITDHIKDVCARAADAGYYAVAPHLFHRTGDPIIPYERMQDVVPHIMSLNEIDIDADIQASLDHCAAKGFTGRQVAIIGFCMGGTISFWAGVKHALGAAITFYGGGITMARFGLKPLIELAPELQTPWFGLYGDHDQSIPLTEVELLRRAAAKAPVETHVKRYADADHGFHCNDRSQYHEASSREAWGYVVRFLDKFVAAS